MEALMSVSCAIVLIPSARAFIPVHNHFTGSTDPSAAVRHRSRGAESSTATRTLGRSIEVYLRSTRMIPMNSRPCAMLAKKRARQSDAEGRNREQSVGQEEEEGIQLEEFRLAKLAEWKALMESGELEEVTKMALDMDVMDQEEAQEVGSRRGSRKNRRKGKQQDPEMADLDAFFEKESDWRDGAGTGSRQSSGESFDQEASEDGSLDGNDLAAELVAGLGFDVVGRGSKYGREGVVDESASEHVGGVGSDRAAGIAGLKRAIRREEKDGRDAEKVIGMVVSAAERDGSRDDELFGFAIKSLARMGRLDLSLRVNEMRQRYLGDGELEGHDVRTTTGLAVALLRTGDEPAALELFASATSGAFASREDAPGGAGMDLGDGEWAKIEAAEWEEERLEAEGDVLPDLLSFYLDRLQRERSQEAAIGVRSTLDRALRRGEFAAIQAEREGQPATFSTKPLAVGVYNQLIRRLGKDDRLAEVFEVLDGMSALGVDSDQETLEFVTNAAVKDVEFETRAVSMKSLPSGNAALPEVVFVGRSNVGKSSLVNMLVNRKALAPTSSVPGYTQHFNYYAVNKGRRRSPSFFLVDVPGLGYARADDGRMDSWRSTLQRYLRVRETLRVVFHLVDVRTGLQKADLQLMSLMHEENKGRSSYVMVLTKCDKVGDAKRALVTEEMRTALQDRGFSSTAPIIATSAKSREGRVGLWSFLRLAFDVDRRRSKGSQVSPSGAGAAATGAGTETAQETLARQL